MCAPAQHDSAMSVLACSKMANAHKCPTSPHTISIATFAHTVRTKANSIKFAHQSFCSPRHSTFLKAIQRRFLKGCPNHSAAGITRYLNPCPASSKGHMKRPHQGIRSTCPRDVSQQDVQRVPLPMIDNVQDFPAPLYADNDDASSNGNSYDSDCSLPRPPNTNLIEDNVSSRDGNIFCFGAFADKHTGNVYSDFTGTFPYMSLEGNVCFFVVYHYESNTILSLPVKNMEDSTIYEATNSNLSSSRAKVECDGQSGKPSNQTLSHLTGVQSPARQTPQSPGQRGQTRNTNLQGPFRQCSCHNGQ